MVRLADGVSLDLDEFRCLYDPNRLHALTLQVRLGETRYEEEFISLSSVC